MQHRMCASLSERVVTRVRVFLELSRRRMGARTLQKNVGGHTDKVMDKKKQEINLYSQTIA